MIMEGSRDTEDGMARTPTERLLQQQIQTLFPRLSRHRHRALARWVLGALLAGSANRPPNCPHARGGEPSRTIRPSMRAPLSPRPWG